MAKGRDSKTRKEVDKPTGAVLILGGGIAGVQTSLDLAESGYKVYLVEKSLSIGGTMAQLDKTFPTNDCAMCILSPKLVDCARHINIELLTRAELDRIEGEVGNFRVWIRKHPRYVDLEKCKGCNDCAEACPVEMPNTYEEGLSKRKAIYRLFEQATPSAFAIDKFGVSPCKATCPLGVNAQGYIQLIKKKKYEEALKLIRERNPFPGITGRVCHHPCEEKCKRQEVDEPISIDLLKRFVADYEIKQGKEPEIPEIEKERDKRIAIVGSGPSGLLCAYDLRLKGYKVVVFESLPVLGGMLVVGIPSYRLPRDILKREIGILEKMGIEFRTNTTIGKDIPLSKLLDEFDAVYIGVGAHISRRLNIEGEDLPGVFGATEFLRRVNLGEKVEVGERVAVVGGGNAAIDAARTVLRLGSKEVTILYRRSRREMPANPEEIEEAEREGIKIEYLTLPKKAMGNGRLERLECIRMRLGEPDESGRRRPIPIEGSEFTIPVDMLIPAISQNPELSGFEDLKLTKWRTIEADEITLQTSIPKVFSGGDCVTGPATYIEAMAAGRRAAESIDRFLKGEDLKEGRELPKPSEIEVDTEGIPKRRRARPLFLSLEERKGNFKEVVLGLKEEDALKEAERCLNCGGCSECMECVKACEPEAILHDMEEEVVEIKVGSIILTPGFDEFIPEIISEYGYGRYPNVVTSIQFERILSASGPFKGEIRRPGDLKHPKRIAWIQCVGSRDEKVNRPYCSSVCCMYATKEAVIAKEHSEDVQPTIFFMDVRSYGKDFEKYINRAKEEHKIRFVYARVGKVEEDPKTHNLWLSYEDETGELKREEFDMVVLSVGLEPSRTNRELAEKLGIELNDYGFAKTEDFTPQQTNIPGIFVAGAFAGPKDVPESVAEGSSAAAYVAPLLSESRGTLTRKKEYPEEKDIRNERPRIGVFVCHCGINIGAYVDVPKVVEYAKKLPYVEYAEENLYTCSADTQIRIKELIKEHNLNRVVVASCTPRTHEPLFQSTIREAGLNPYLFAMANIRDQDSWVHMHQPEEATEKAKHLVKMAVYKAALLMPLSPSNIPITKKALVIGGGITGMNSALRLADAGFETFLVERDKELGGNARYIYFGLNGEDVQEYLEELKGKVESHPKIKVYKGKEIEKVDGYVGNFKTTLSDGTEFEHGVVIVATGAEEYKPKEYLYGKDKRVLTQREFEDLLAKDSKLKTHNSIVMIQCVGSRNEEHPWCSRICCQEALKNALKFKEKNPQGSVYILFRDIRTYGFSERLYSEARSKGIVFIRYSEERPPQVIKRDGKIEVKIYDRLLKEDVILSPDLLILSAGVVPDRENNERLSKLLKVPINEDGFFLEAHMKLRPVDFATDGIFLAGLAHSPKNIRESISQANAAVSRALTVLTKDSIETSGIVASVNELKCVGCGICVSVCPYSALDLEKKKVLGREKEVSSVNPALCKGCGACAAACRMNAIDLQGFTNEEVLSEIEALAYA